MNLIEKLAVNPKVFMFLRRIIEGNFTAEKAVLKNEMLSIGECKRILDIGCGTGMFSKYFENISYVGIDTEKIYIDYAKKFFKGKFYLMNGENLLFENSSFNSIIVFGVFHHLNDIQSKNIIKEMKRVLSGNGKVIIMEDVNIESKYDIIGNVIRRFDRGKYIRIKDEYVSLFNEYFKIKKTYRLKSGLVTYDVFVC